MDTFSALAEPTRRNILEILATKGTLSATDIYNKFTVSQPAISQHLKILRDTNLVRVEKNAQKRLYTINPKPMLEMEEWIEKMARHWNVRFDALDKVLIAEKKKLKKLANVKTTARQRR